MQRKKFVITLENSKQKLILPPRHPFLLLSQPFPLSTRDSCRNVTSTCKMNFDYTNEIILEPDLGVSAQIRKEHHTTLSMALWGK